MERIVVIGDAHTVNAFRICGFDGVAADVESAGAAIKSVIESDDPIVILVTGDCAEPNSGLIRKVNLESPKRVIISIQGIDEGKGFGRSLTSYITEALGVAL